MDSQEINTTEGNPPVSLQQPNFYNEYGQVQDPGVAHELADIEKSGKDSALKYEEVKKQEFETGLTEDERYNNEVVELLKEHFPNALKEGQDPETGEKYYYSGLRVLPEVDMVHIINNDYYKGFIKPERLAMWKKLESLYGDVKKRDSFERGHWEIIALSDLSSQTFFSKHGIQSVRDYRAFNPLLKSVSLKDISEENQVILFKILSVIDAYAADVKNEPSEPEIDLNSIDSIEERIKAVKGEQITKEEEGFPPPKSYLSF